MAVSGVFIGISRHHDVGIQDLSGSTRDALALGALFEDSIPGLQATTLLDAHATHTAIRATLQSTLASASEQDVVIITFAGHGSDDHRLVAHDTALGDFEATSIDMQDIADWFHASRARAVVCVLDCCYSGGATARAVTGRPTSRGLRDPLQALAGRGRVLIAASALDEPAYEHPTLAHGLLSYALINALKALHEPAEVLSLAATLGQTVRAAAAQLGVTQNPAILGHVEGGLSIGPITMGPLYEQRFPERSAFTTDGTIAGLAQFGIEGAVLAAWQERFGGGLNDLQQQAINQGRVLDGASLLVVAPTSSGKTFIGELAAVRAALDGRKSVFLLPYKALVNEKFDEFQALYGHTLNLRVLRCTGDRTDDVPALLRGKYDFAFLTYELFLNLVVNVPQLLRQLGLVVLDEAQFITDPGRGIVVELLLTYLRMVRTQGLDTQIVALSAVIGHLNQFEAWLECRALVTTERPVPLVEGVLDRSGVFQYLDEHGAAHIEQLVPADAIRQRTGKASAQDVIVPLVRDLLAKNSQEKIIIFRNQRGSAEGSASYLAEDLGLPPAVDATAALPAHDRSSTSARLVRTLQGGVAFHTTNLSRDEKVVVERAFRDPVSPLRVLCATTGVAAGVNTPASTVIVAEQEFLGEDGRPFTVAEYKNMVGRAGRLGFAEQGRSIVLADNGRSRQELFDRYVCGTPEPLRSSFAEEDLATWILRLVTQVMHLPRGEVTTLLVNTYGGFLRVRQHPEWLASMQTQIEILVDEMVALGLLEVVGGDLELTLLGRACGSSNLSFQSAMRLLEILRRQDLQSLTPETLMALVQVLPEMDSAYTPMFKKGTSENRRSTQVVQRYGSVVSQFLQSGARGDPFVWLARCKRAAILWDWIHGAEVATIEAEFASNNPYSGVIGRGHIQAFADTTRFHLRSAADIVLLLGSNLEQGNVDQLLRQLEEGLPVDALPLLDLPLRLTRGEYLALYSAGFRSAQDVVAAEPQRLTDLISQVRLGELLAAQQTP